MKTTDLFPSKYLKAETLGPNVRTIVTISHVAQEVLNGEPKPILYFTGKTQGLVLNRTNADTITEMAGSAETDDWPGTRLMLYTTKVPYQGKMVLGIRFEAPPAMTAAKPKPKPQPVAAADGMIGEDEIPFSWVVGLISAPALLAMHYLSIMG